ncbi:restriction endonuclease subunit S [Achromobacter xylosoxidans]|uniref:restriction endonuclease subunit S n=1 Tax=Alcaligenes xylosoxydans xylosoxydans TaxID=85698 RepID=UPI001F12E378|nr:restriction endonuclease subunit S [Achromobacter xylosoxidans]
MSFPLVSLGDFVEIARNGISPEKIQRGTNYVGLENIDGSGNFVDVKGVDAGELASSKLLFTQKQVLFGKLRPYLKKIARPDFDGICSTDILPLLPSKEIDRDYLFHTLRRQSFVDDVSSLSSGANLPRISPKVLSEMQIPLPPLKEQRRIATILDKADALRAQRRAAIAKLDDLLQSVFIAMFGDPMANPKGWPIRKIADLLESVKYGSSDKATQEGEIPILRMNNLTYSGQIELTELKYITAKQADEKYLVEPGDILFNRTNSKELVGKTAVYDGPIPMAYAGYLVRGRVNQSNAPEYISAFLNSIWGKAILRNMCKNIVGMANINAREFGSIELPVPPSELQRKYQFYVRAVRAQKQRMQGGMKKLDELFASLQQRAFSGKL